MMSLTNTPKKIAVIGGGAAGMTAAIFAAEQGAKVTLFERNTHSLRSPRAGEAFLGKKLRITGKGRCNLTNNCGINDFLTNVPRNPKFLYKSITAFSPSDTMDFFTSLGVELKTERGNRVFPSSDRAADIVAALENRLHSLGVHVVHTRVKGVADNNGKAEGVITDNGIMPFDSVILCTGGASYPTCGSTGDGYKFASSLGHTVVPPKPSLVPLVSTDSICKDCMGLTLKNANCSFYSNTGKLLYRDQGELLFAHFGVTGPIALSASAHLKSFPVVLRIDLKPALDFDKLGKRVLRDFSEQLNKEFCNSLSGLLPAALISPIIARSGINPKKRVNEITKEERKSLVKLFKSLEIELSGTRPIDEAVITSGGVAVKEINPSTMESKIVRGLYFAGEIIDCDAYTGGFNLQIAFSTAHTAANAAVGSN